MWRRDQKDYGANCSLTLCLYMVDYSVSLLNLLEALAYLAHLWPGCRSPTSPKLINCGRKESTVSRGGFSPFFLLPLVLLFQSKGCLQQEILVMALPIPL